MCTSVYAYVFVLVYASVLMYVPVCAYVLMCKEGSMCVHVEGVRCTSCPVTLYLSF